ncbi:MAG: amino acid ABC transporter permease [Spirochaetota bacterium]
MLKIETDTPVREHIKFLAFTGVLVFTAALSAGNLSYEWHWNRIPGYIISVQNGSVIPGPLLKGLWVTIKISILSMIFAFIIAIVTAFFRLSSSFTSRFVSYWYIETIRNTPLLIQIFFMYFVVAPILGINAFFSAVIALSLFEGAYASEIFRAGVLSIRKGQWEAASSLGLTWVQSYRYVILPQAFRRVLPPLTGQGVSLIKDTALVSTVSIFDLTMEGQRIVSETFLTFEVWFTVAFIYIIMTGSLSMFSAWLGKRYSVS